MSTFSSNSGRERERERVQNNPRSASSSSSSRLPIHPPNENAASVFLNRKLRFRRMSLLEESVPLLFLTSLRHKARLFTETLIQQATASMSASSCSSEGGGSGVCRDDEAAFRLKMMAIVAILFAGVGGVAIPLVGRKRRFLRTDGSLFVLAKAFAAGVILATGFVHMLHDAQTALTDPCLPESPWQRFPFSGFIAMFAALGTLVVDFVSTQMYERKHREEQMGLKSAASAVSASAAATASDAIVAVAPEFDEEAGSGGKSEMHIVGIRAHAAAHRHTHADEHGHGHAHDDDGQVSSHVRHVVVSQILELGIVSHSVIIGLSLGVSQNPCTIRPLIAALSFHQFFEGFALGGCISQAQFKNAVAVTMACFFAITTPAGVAVGTAVARQYNASSARALVVEGILDSVSAGILIYMALVDLIAADFLSSRMSCNFRMQVASYVALFLGAASMSSLAIWA